MCNADVPISHSQTLLTLYLQVEVEVRIKTLTFQADLLLVPAEQEQNVQNLLLMSELGLMAVNLLAD